MTVQIVRDIHGRRVAVVVPQPSSVLLAIPHEVMREGLLTVLRRCADLEPVGTNTLLGLDTVTADLVLVDVVALLDHSPAGSGVLRRLLDRGDVPVLAIGHDLRPDLADRALDLGVQGCVSASWPAARIEAAVRTVLAGGDLTSLQVNPARPRPVTMLTPRESEVLARITLGQRNGEIAADLHLSINSVKSSVRMAYRRIGVASRTQAVAWAVLHGFPLRAPAARPPHAP